MGMAELAPEDDDGEAASAKPVNTKPPTKTKQGENF